MMGSEKEECLEWEAENLVPEEDDWDEEDEEVMLPDPLTWLQRALDCMDRMAEQRNRIAFGLCEVIAEAR